MPTEPAIEQGWAIAKLDAFSRSTGALLVTVITTYGTVGPANDWVITPVPGITETSRIYYDRAIRCAYAASVYAAQAAADRAYVESVRNQLVDTGLDPEVFAWRNGSRPFTGVQWGVAPSASANDGSLPTAAWTRARVAEGAASFGPTPQRTSTP